MSGISELRPDEINIVAGGVTNGDLAIGGAILSYVTLAMQSPAVAIVYGTGLVVGMAAKNLQLQ